MNRTGTSRLLARALAGFAAAITIALLAGTPAHAQTITISGSACAVDLTWNSATKTLSCPASGPPTCTVTGPTTGTIGTAIALTANCNPGATSFAWTGGACAGVTTATCSPNESSSGTVNYTVQGTNGNGAGAVSAAYPVVWSSTPPPPPPPSFACTFATPGAATAGMPLSLTVNCANGTVASATWTATNSSCTSNCTPTFGTATPLSGNTGYANSVTLQSSGTWLITANVTGSGTTPASVQAQVSVTVQQPQTQAISCSGFANTRVLTMPAWTLGSGNIHIFTADAGHLGPNDAVVVEVTAPSVLATNRFGSLSFADVAGDPPASRRIVLSDRPCEFSSGLDGSSRAIVSGTTAGSVWFSGGPNSYGYPAMQVPNGKYYFNIRNLDGACTSNSGHCDLDLALSPPPK